MLKRIDKILLFSTLILFLTGLIMVFSASNVTSFMQYEVSPYHFFARQLIFLVVSIILGCFIIRFSTKTYGYISWFAVIGLIGLLIVVLVNGKLINQARSWIELFGGVTLQPSEFVKVATIVWMASFCNGNNKGFKGYLLLFAIIGLITVLIMLQPDLGTASIFVMIVFMMFTSLNISKKVKRNIVLTVLIVGVLVIALLMNNGVQLFFERQLGRFDYFNPCSEEKFYSTGTQVCNGFIAFNNGGLLGAGLGNSTQKYLYLPEPYTDFIFAIVVEELGFVGASAILIMMFIVLWRIFIIAKDSKSSQNRMMCYGIFWYLLIHIIVNLGGVTGLIPLTGVPLPFLSYGGSYLMCVVVALTIVQRVAIENKLSK